MFGLLFDINADMNNVPGVDQDGMFRLDRYEYWPCWLLAFAFKLAELLNKPGKFIDQADMKEINTL